MGSHKMSAILTEFDEVDGTDPGSWPVAGFGISGVKFSISSITRLYI
jgi:hypothetical protein